MALKVGVVGAPNKGKSTFFKAVTLKDVDIANYLLNALPIGITINSQRSLAKRLDDSAEFFLQYKSGASVHIQANWITPIKIRNFTVTGTKGYLEADYLKQEVRLYKKQSSLIALSKIEPLKAELSYFINCIQNNIKIDSQYALDALKICLI